MRLPSGVTDQYIYFVAVDSSDYVTMKTGLSSFTAYRSRNGGTATAYTTPTITEVSSSNMPGVYKFLIDEDMTIDSGDDEQEVCLRITATGMAPVTRVYSLYRVKATAGETIGVSSGAVTNVTTTATATAVTTVNGLANGVITANSIASNALTAAKFASGAFDAVWSVATRLLTAGTNIVLAKGTGVTGFNDLSQSDVRGAVGLASANLDTQLSTIDGVADAIKAKTDNLPADPADASDIDDALAALESHGDSNWSTATGFATSSDLATVDANVDQLLLDVAGLPDASEVADAVLDEPVEGTTTLRQSVRLANAALGGKASGLDTTTAVYRDIGDTTDRITATVDEDGNRDSVTLDLD